MTKSYVCTICKKPVERNHCCTDGAIYAYHSRRQDPEGYAKLIDEVAALIRTTRGKDDEGNT